jgi:hypothetical protein
MKTILALAVMGSVALLAGCNYQQAGPAQMVTTNQSRNVAGETVLSVDVRIDIGSLEISSAPGPSLYDLSIEYDKSAYQPDVSYQPGSEGQLLFKLEGRHEGGIRERHNNRVRLNFGETVPVSLKVDTGVGDARLALSRLKITKLELEAGVGGARVSAYEPNSSICSDVRIRNGVGSLDAVGLGNLNFNRLEFEGGVGGANLDFSGQWKRDAEIRLAVGVGGVSVRMPREVGVRVVAERHFLSGLQLDGFERTGGEDYYSEKYNEKKVRVTIVVKTGIGGFRISWL